jgi:hypothetical protein
MSNIKPEIVEEFLKQCSPTKNGGITVLTHPGDFFMGWGWFEKFCMATNKSYKALETTQRFRPDMKAYPPRPGQNQSYDIQPGDFFGGLLDLGEGGKIVMRRSSSSDVHKPTMELQGLEGLKHYLTYVSLWPDSEEGWISNADKQKYPDKVRVEIKFQGNLVAYMKS